MENDDETSAGCSLPPLDNNRRAALLQRILAELNGRSEGQRSAGRRDQHERCATTNDYKTFAGYSLPPLDVNLRGILQKRRRESTTRHGFCCNRGHARRGEIDHGEQGTIIKLILSTNHYYAPQRMLDSGDCPLQGAPARLPLLSHLPSAVSLFEFHSLILNATKWNNH